MSTRTITPAFSGTKKMALKHHHAAATAAKLVRTTNHQWRHTYAVAELRAGEKATVVAYQLGHRDASLVWKRYGRYVPEAIDYRADPEADSATNLATPQLQKKQS